MRKIQLTILSMLPLMHFIKCIKLITSDVTENAKFTCDDVKKHVFNVQSELQCHHRCLTKPKCEIMNYKTSVGGKGKQNCEVFEASRERASKICAFTESDANWKAVVFEVIF